MKKILLILVMLSTGYAFSQSMPPTFPVEMYYGCTYEKGKDIEDMMEVGEEWREWQEENDPVGRENDNAWIFRRMKAQNCTVMSNDIIVLINTIFCVIVESIVMFLNQRGRL